MGHKEKDKKEKKDKHKRDKVKKDKKTKKSSKHRRKDSDSSSSDSDVDYETAEQQLRRERAAVNKLRDILSVYPPVRKELREMIWRVDQGEAANVSGIPDPELKQQLVTFLELLKLRRNDKGIYGLASPGAKVLPIVSFVFDEPPRAPPPKPAPQPAPQPAAEPQPPQQHAAKDDPDAQPTAGPSGRGGGGVKPEGAVKAEEGPGVKAEEGAGADAGHAGGPTGRRVGPIGPMGPPPGAGAGSSGGGGGDGDGEVTACVKEEEEEEEAEPQVAPEPPKRRAGPAMPPPELLAAAAAAADAMKAAGPEGTVRLRYGESDDDDDFMVGPAPPELVEELDAAPQDAREAEVVRIMRVLREHGATPDTLDAYDVLGVAPDAAGPEVKKRYMRLSLLIHPDKCDHKMAHEAFQAVATSARVLQDSSLRGKLDERRKDEQLRKMAEAAAAQQERERAWRVARGEEAEAGPSGRSGPTGPSRETWMTDLPPEMSASMGGQMSQQSVRAFAARGKTGRGDTSAWTDTPEQRKAKEAQAMLQAASDSYVHALPAPAGPGGGVSAATVAAVDAFNAGVRPKSLMEKHLELQAAAQEKATREAKEARKAAKKQKREQAEGGGAAAEAGDWPWRPFDRDKDLEIKPSAKSGVALIKQAGALGNKFSSSGGQRHFL